MSYKILEMENLPEALKNKPRWISCIAFTAAVLTVTMSAIAVGVIFGYTYCYIEHHSTIRTGNVTHSTNLQIVNNIPYIDTDEARHNRTINGALMSNVIISRILKIGHAITNDDLANLVDEHSDMGLKNL